MEIKHYFTLLLACIATLVGIIIYLGILAALKP